MHWVQRYLLIAMFGSLQAGAQVIQTLDTTVSTGTTLGFQNNNTWDHRNERKLKANYFPYVDTAYTNFCSAYLPVREALDTLSFSNTGNTNINGFYFFLNDNRNMNLDSLVLQIFGNCATSREKTLALYQFVRDRHLYYFAVDKVNPVYENYDAAKLLNVYGIGNCGMIANMAAQLAHLYTGNSQRHWYLNNGSHGVSEVRFDSSLICLDADEDGLYLLPDNKTLASFYDVYMDSQHYLRSMHFGNAAPFRYNWNTHFNNVYRIGNHYINHTDTLLNVPEPCCPKLSGLLGENLQFTLRPGSTIRYIPNDTMTVNHFVHTQPAPTLATVLPIIGKGQMHQILHTQGAQTHPAWSAAAGIMAQSADSTYRTVAPPTDGNLIFREQCPYVMSRAWLDFLYELPTPGDSLNIFFSRDSINWRRLNWTPQYGPGFKTVRLDLLNLIAPNDSVALYHYFVRWTLRGNGAALKKPEVLSQFQYSKLGGPALDRGLNTLRCFANGISNLRVKFRWKEDNLNQPPLNNMQPLFPANNLVSDSSAFTFRWSVPTDPDGDSIVDYQIQISDRADMAYPLSTLHDRFLKLSNGGKPEFRPEVNDYFNHLTPYYWRVRAQDSKGVWSEWSPIWSFRVKTPMYPRNLRWSILADSLKDVILLQWTPNAEGDTARYFNVMGSGSILGFEALPSKFYANCLQPQIAVHFPTGRKRFRVRAAGAAGSESASSYFINLPLSKNAILGASFNYLDTFANQLSCKTQPFPPVNLENRPLFYLVSDTSRMQINGNTLTAVGTGFVMVDICTRINSDTIRVLTAYVRVVPALPAPALKPTLLIWAKDTVSVYGNPVIHNGFSYFGFAANHSPNTLQTLPVMSPGADSTSDAGLYSLMPAGAFSPLYNMAYQPGILNIQPRPLTLRADDTTLAYGSSAPVWTFSAQGLANDDIPDSLDVQPVFSTAWTPQSLPGTYGLQLSAASDKNYSISAYLPGTVTVGKATLNANPVASTSVYGDIPTPAGISYTGFVNGEGPGILISEPQAVIAANLHSHTGLYPVTLQGGQSDRYDFQFGNASHQITPAPLTITCLDTQSVYGANHTHNGFSLSGLKGDDTKDSLQQWPQFSITATAASPTGTYPITASGAADLNYTISYLPGTLTIGKAPLWVKPLDSLVEYGSLPASGFSGSLHFTGFVNGDNATQLDQLPQSGSWAGPSSPPGTYAIFCSGGLDDQYHYQYDTAQLIITKATLAIIADSSTSVYGQDPVLQPVRYAGFKGNDSVAMLSAVPQLITTADRYSASGVYPVIFQQTAIQSDRYNLLFIPALHTVKKKNLEIKADDQTLFFRDSLQTLSCSISGWENGDNLPSLSQQPEVSTTYVPGALAGEYPITIGPLTDARYQIQTLGGTLLVRPTLPEVKLSEVNVNVAKLHYRVALKDHGGQILSTGLQIARLKDAFSFFGDLPCLQSEVLTPPYVADFRDSAEIQIVNEELVVRAYARNEAGIAYSETRNVERLDDHFLQVIGAAGQNELHILSGSNYRGGYAELFSAEGRQIARYPLNQNVQTIRLSNQSTGIYYLRCFAPKTNQYQTEKLLIR